MRSKILKTALRRAKAQPEYLSRFNDYIEAETVSRGPIGSVCRNWTGSCRDNGHGNAYPQYSVTLDNGGSGGVDVRRFAWALAGKSLANKHCLQMACKNNLCVNVDHMRPVHISKISMETNKKKRKLPWKSVQHIRDSYANGDVTLRALGENYGVPFQYIHKIVTHKIYREE